MDESKSRWWCILPAALSSMAAMLLWEISLENERVLMKKTIFVLIGILSLRARQRVLQCISYSNTVTVTSYIDKHANLRICIGSGSPGSRCNSHSSHSRGQWASIASIWYMIIWYVICHGGRQHRHCDVQYDVRCAMC